MGYNCGFSSIDKRLMSNYTTNMNFYDYTKNLEDTIAECLDKDVDLILDSGEVIPSAELKELYKVDKYGYTSVTNECCSWCSAGRHLTDLLRDIDITTDPTDGVMFLTQKEIIRILATLCNRIFATENVKHYDIEYGIKIDDVTDDGEDIYKLIPLDGVELRNVDTNEYSKVYVSDDECAFNYIDISYDIDNVLTDAIKCLADMLQTIDFDHEMIYLWESY